MSQIGKIQELITVTPQLNSNIKPPTTAAPSFEQLLQETEKKLKLSAHAEKRLNERGINLSQEDLQKISQALDQAKTKGAKNSLVLYGDLAIIASAINKTVITVSKTNQLEQQIVTNIDSAILLK